MTACPDCDGDASGSEADLRRLVDELVNALRRIAFGELPAPHIYARAILKETVGL